MRAKLRRLALAGVVMLVSLTAASDGVAQSTRSAAPSASLQAYLPKVERLQKADDMAGLEQLSRQAVLALQARFGPRSSEVATAFRWLAEALGRQGRKADAELVARRALAIDETASGKASPAVASDLHGIAHLLGSQGRYAEAEPFVRRELAIQEHSLGPDDAEAATSVSNLAELLRAQGRYADAEPLYRRALAIRMKTLGPGHAETLASLDSLARILEALGRDADAEQVVRQAVAILETVRGALDPSTAVAVEDVADLIQGHGRFAEAEQLYRRALAIREKSLGPGNVITATSLNNLGRMVEAQERPAEAEALFRRALAIYESVLGPEDSHVATALNNLAGLSQSQHRYAEAEPLFRRALAIREKVSGPGHPETAMVLNNLALTLTVQDRFKEAEPLFVRSLDINLKARGLEDPLTVAGLGNLAAVLEGEGRPAEAERLYQRALEIDVKTTGADSQSTAGALNSLANFYRSQGRFRDAEPMLRRALAILEHALGPQHRFTAGVHLTLGRNDESLGELADAAANYRLGCSTRSAIARTQDLSADSARDAQRRAGLCWTWLTLTLWEWSAQGGGPAPADRPAALTLEGFATSQRALQSAAGDAMARSAALTAATSAAVGDQAQAYEAALLERDRVDQQFAKAADVAGKVGVDKREQLAKAHDAAVAEIGRTEADIKSKAPLYWDYRSPEPIGVAALQARSGSDAVLLRNEEALIVFLAATGKEKGLVFAVTKEHVAWASLGMTGDEIQARVVRLRGQIDPAGYGLRGIGVEQHDAPASAPSAEPVSGAFDRQAAYELYQALLGDPAIQAVIKDKPVLLFVPSGALTSLPPGLLVTASPAGGVAGDTDPAALRATPWLLRSKAVALLPAVASLRTLRQLLPTDRGTAPDPLLAFANPDFDRSARAPTKRVHSAAARGFSGYYRDGVPLAEALNFLPPLPGTLIEGEALERALGATPASLLTGRNASKAQLMARNRDGRLVRVRVLEFATHGLVAGDASDLAEPALALAAGATPADELLLASEASTLKLNADWVLLSACNTASPDAPEAQGLSGLSRAFFYAGARSLLVSHWRVRDDVAPQLIPAMLLAERKEPTLSHAQALRRASLAVLDDHSLNAADPSAWAAFTLIGEAAR